VTAVRSKISQQLSHQPLDPFRSLGVAGHDIGNVVVLSIEIGYGDSKHPSKVLGRQEIGTVHAEFVPVYARAGDKGVKAGLNSQLLLGQVSFKSRLSQALAPIFFSGRHK
jgi:hypothetical protein